MRILNPISWVEQNFDTDTLWIPTATAGSYSQTQYEVKFIQPLYNLVFHFYILRCCRWGI